MPAAPLPQNEAERLQALHALRLLDTPVDERFERVTRTAQRVFGVPIALVTLVDANRQWFKSCIGLPYSETSRDIAFCAYALLGEGPLIIPDASKDPRFQDNSLVTGDSHIRFYAGQPMRSEKGLAFGTLCILDREPREMSASDIQTLSDLAAWAEDEINSRALRHESDLLRASEDRIQTVMDTAADGIITYDEHNTIESVNAAAARLFGGRGRQFIGTSIDALIPRAAECVPTTPPAEQQQRRTLRLIGEHRQAEGVRRDGSIFPVDLAISIVRRGRHTRYIAIVHDITVRRENEQRLQHAHSEIRAVLDATSEAIIFMGPDQRFLAVNQRFTSLFGIPGEAVVGKQFDELREHVERIFADPAALSASMRQPEDPTGRPFSWTVTQVWPEPRELELYSRAVRGPEGVGLGRLHVFRDVTHERAVDRMKSEFVSLVSHELRTPLTSIKGYVDLLLDGDAGEVTEEQQEYLTIVRNNSDRLVALINDLLDVSRIESGKIQLQRASLAVAPLIQQVTESLHLQIAGKEQSLTTHIEPELPPVLGDADRITQILTNLLSNAYKYTPRGGSITLSAHADDGSLRVDVTDSGIGMTSDELSHLFTKFYRAQNRTTQEVGGTGLGLTITKSLVEMHGGSITVTSAYGQGSTFSFTLPFDTAATHVPTIVTASTSTAPGKCVLVVDDEPDIANLIARYLERAGYRVLVAHTAAEAMACAQREHPDLITLDVMLPDADGFTVLEWLKASPATAAIPVVMLSMLPPSDRGKQLGAVDYLSKPIQEDTLVQRLQAVFANDRAHRILVAEDDPDLRALLVKNIRRAGYEPIEAADGAEAVELAQRHLPGLALLDISMPHMDGIAALRALRALPATSAMPIIMMTASPGVMDASRPLIAAIEGTALIGKPWSPEELAAAIARGLAGTLGDGGTPQAVAAGESVAGTAVPKLP